MMMKYSQKDQDDARAMLAKHCPPGTLVYTSLRHVSRSGMMRHISLFVLLAAKDGQPADIQDITYYTAAILGNSIAKDNGIRVSGCGMDMGFHIVHSLSYNLHKDGYVLKQRWM